MQQEANDPDVAFFGVTPEADIRQSFSCTNKNVKENLLSMINP
jgi:hypothetical protein